MELSRKDNLVCLAKGHTEQVKDWLGGNLQLRLEMCFILEKGISDLDFITIGKRHKIRNM